jgi:rhamnose transport system substrate-binding protein
MKTKLAVAAAMMIGLAQPVLAADKIALVVKALGIGFFDATHQGALEAAKELAPPKPRLRDKLKSSTA